MKKCPFAPLLLLLCLLVQLLAPAAGAVEYRGVEPLTLEATAAVLIDMDSDQVLFEQNADEQRYPASITKVMTVLLVLEAISRGELSLDTVVTVSAAALDGLPADASHANPRLVLGEQISVKDLLYCTMVRSANEGANALALTVAGDMASFVERMNQRAQELGMTGTHFANPNGLHDPNHYSTARDIYRVCKEAMGHSIFREIVGTGQYQVPATNLTAPRTLYTTNGLLARYSYPGYVYSGTIGIKTGNTGEAGHCLASAVTRKNHTLVAVVLGAGEDVNAAGQVTLRKHFSESIRLYDWGFDNFSAATLVDAEEWRKELPLRFSLQTAHVIVQPKESINVLIPGEYDPEKLELREDLGEYAFAPISAGQVLGTLTAVYNGQEYGTVELAAVNGVELSPFLAFVDSVNSFFGNRFVQVLLIVSLFFLALGVVRRIRNNRRLIKQQERRRRLEHKRQQAEEKLARDEARRQSPDFRRERRRGGRAEPPREAPRTRPPAGRGSGRNHPRGH